jgi:1-deoxy-D-xylulose-5-phosphate reductoisomerase
LEATYEAIRAASGSGLANKEVLVSGGRLVMEAVRESGALLVPVDSEHNGAHQCLRAGNRNSSLAADPHRFRRSVSATRRVKLLDSVTPEQALNHPTWKMGKRITIDCATLMNKGFEVIEACWLFDFAPIEVDVVVHPQSKVHAMIEYSDGSVLAQISATDMRMPIQYALTYPERHASAGSANGLVGSPPVGLFAAGGLQLRLRSPAIRDPARRDRFPALRAAVRGLRQVRR